MDYNEDDKMVEDVDKKSDYQSQNYGISKVLPKVKEAQMAQSSAAFFNKTENKKLN